MAALKSQDQGVPQVTLPFTVFIYGTKYTLVPKLLYVVPLSLEIKRVLLVQNHKEYENYSPLPFPPIFDLLSDPFLLSIC